MSEKHSKVESIKESSNFLAGDIAAQLREDTEAFHGDAESLLKFHGTYGQDDRDDRGQVNPDGTKKKTYIFMVRTKIPGGKLTSQQVLDELDLADELGNTTLRITSRQGFQLHGVVKKNLKSVIRRINETQLSTLGACGDVNRNVICCPAPYASNIYRETQALADKFAAYYAPRSKAYYETWMTDADTGEKQLVGGATDDASDGFDVEPIYGKRYMPRKFKIGIAFPFDNCIDVYANDLGLLAITEGDRIVGYNVLAGGGMGATPSNKKTFPAVAKRICFATPEQVFQVVEAVFKVQRDFGNREDRKQARLKYLIHNWGVEKFKAQVEEYFGGSLPDPDPTDVHEIKDHMGWDEQGDGLLFYGLNIENGRIKDTPQIQLKSAVREICRTLKPGIRNTAHQSMIFSNIRPEDKNRLEDILHKHNVPLTEEISTVRRWSMACVAWPTCGLSITESERALPGMIDQMEVELARLGLSKERFTVRMTGCPNGCARPYNCDIGLVGRARDKYTIFLGGRALGDRINFLYKDMVPHDDVVPTLTPVFAYFKQFREKGESLGEFCLRKGQADLLAYAEKHATSLVA